MATIGRMIQTLHVMPNHNEFLLFYTRLYLTEIKADKYDKPSLKTQLCEYASNLINTVGTTVS